MTRLGRDLDEIVERGRDDFDALRGTRIFITGGTGFVGSWLLESFAWANRRLALHSRAVVLTRDPNAFSSALPHLAQEDSIDFVRGDVRDFNIDGAFDAIVHAATPASAKINNETPLVMLDTIVDGMRRTLAIAERSGAIPFLLTSSGAVYGRQPPELPLLDESYVGGPDILDSRNVYHEAKRLAELQLAVAGQVFGTRAKIARLFAFVGPYLPLDRHFAVGNFVRDALAARPIAISGDGTPIRTYLYAADMTNWLWRVLARGTAGRAYNVGSERVLSILQVAQSVAASVEPSVDVAVAGVATAGVLPERYAPSTKRARAELGLCEWTPFESAIERTIAWHRSAT